MTKFWFTGPLALAIVFGSGIAARVEAAEQPPLRCGPEARIDGSTADEARKKMSAAGYTQITDLKKGCDNFWHGKAMKDGSPTGVLLSPDGRVQSEWRGD